MRRNLPFYLLSAWFFCRALFALGKLISPGVIGHEWPQRVGVILAGVLLSLTILFAIVSAVQGERRQECAAALAAAVALQIGSTSFYLWASTVEGELAALVNSRFTVERLAERALNSPVSRGRELAASQAFSEFGTRIPYADDSGNVRTFEPTSADLVRRESHNKLQADTADTQAVLRRLAMTSRWAALANLLAFGAVLVGGAIVLGGPKRWHGWLTSR
jgi:hypothetical protein